MECADIGLPVTTERSQYRVRFSSVMRLFHNFYSPATMSCRRMIYFSRSNLLQNVVRYGCKSFITGTAKFPSYCRTMASAFSSPRLNLDFQKDGTALVTMKSGDNKLHPDMLDEWHIVLDHIEKNTECRVMVTTGVDKFFSNGLDLPYVKTFTHHERQLAEYLDKLNRLVVRILVFPLPTVAAINGHAFAGGAVLAIAHDLRVMREDKGWVCLNEILVNVRFPAVLMALMRTKIPPGPAQTEAILFAKRFTAPEALHYGIVNKMADQSQLLDVSKELASQALGKDEICRDNLGLFKKDLYKYVLNERQIHS